MATTTALMNVEPASAATTMKALLHQGLAALNEQRNQRYRAAKGLAPDAPEPKRTGLYASEVGTVIGEDACWRKVFYTVAGTQRDPLTTESMLAMAIGDRIEGLYVEALLATGEIEKIQVPIPFTGYPITGRLDVLVRRDRMPVELKSTTIKVWNHLPKQAHLDQTLMYLHGLRSLTAYADITEALTVYLAKDAPKGHEGIRAYPVQYDPARMREILETYQLAWDAANDAVLPPRPAAFKPGEWPCAYCSWKSTCWSAVDG